MLVIGIIGNIHGHLSGAEKVAEQPVPNGIFIVPVNEPETLTEKERIRYPAQGTNVDIEPEFVLRCKVSYEDGKVSALAPFSMTIGNDFTIRQLTGSDKISQRKSWGRHSKGLHTNWWPLEGFCRETLPVHTEMVSWIERDDTMQLATEAVGFDELKLFYAELLEWVTERINLQEEFGMYDRILPGFEEAGWPGEILLYTGAPNYSAWGEEHFLQRGDRVHIACYDKREFSADEAEKMFVSETHQNDSRILSFSQLVV